MSASTSADAQAGGEGGVGQVPCDGRLALAGARRGEHQAANRLVPGEAQVHLKHPERLGHLGRQVRERNRPLQRAMARDRRQDRRVEGHGGLLRAVEAAIALLAQEGEAAAQHGAEQHAQQNRRDRAAALVGRARSRAA